MPEYKKKNKVNELYKEKPSVNDKERVSNFKISFQYLDTAQKYGSAFKDWQNIGLLSYALETLHGYCCSPLRQQIDGDKFTIYGSFPPKERTLFEFPKNVPEDASWARIHVNEILLHTETHILACLNESMIFQDGHDAILTTEKQ